MESRKNSNSETSSEEIDQPEKLINDNTVRIAPFYECTFCKRGFTNAQALGGDMNIHRKDKAQAKQKNSHLKNQSSLAKKSSEDYNTSFKYFAPISSEQQKYSPAVAAYISYRLYSSRYDLYAYQYYHSFSSPRYEKQNHHALHEYHRDQSLSLSISPPSIGDRNERKISRNENNPVGLELRLGHHP